jgi:hypothetical protein
MRMKRISPALVAVLALAAPAAANASVTINPDGTGFVGKGDVQTVFGMNNSALQAAAPNVKQFLTMQSASQPLSQTATQSATEHGSQTGSQSGSQVIEQTATQTTTEHLECKKTNGQVAQQNRTGTKTGTKVGSRTGSRTVGRDVSRDGTRTSTRFGSRTGSLNGDISAVMNADARKSANQFTGFNLLGWKPGFAPTFVPGTTVMGSYDFPAYEFGPWAFGEWSGDWHYGADQLPANYTFGATVWGAWDTDNTNAEPDVCLNSSGNVNANVDPTSLVHTYTDGPLVENAVQYLGTTVDPIVADSIVEGRVDEDAIHEDAIVPTGPVAASGPIKLSLTVPGYSPATRVIN